MSLGIKDSFLDFKEETEDTIENIERILIKIEKSPSISVTEMRQISKLINKITGAALIIGITEVAKFTEIMEEICGRMASVQNEENIRKITQLFFRTLDYLHEGLDTIEKGMDDIFPTNEDLFTVLNITLLQLGGATKRLDQNEIDDLIDRMKKYSKK